MLVPPQKSLLWRHPPMYYPKKTRTSRERAQSIEKKTSESNKIFVELKKKHVNAYKPEQLHAWAELVQMEKHESLDDPFL